MRYLLAAICLIGVFYLLFELLMQRALRAKRCDLKEFHHLTDVLEVLSRVPRSSNQTLQESLAVIVRSLQSLPFAFMVCVYVRRFAISGSALEYCLTTDVGTVSAESVPKLLLEQDYREPTYLNDGTFYVLPLFVYGDVVGLCAVSLERGRFEELDQRYISFFGCLASIISHCLTRQYMFLTKDEQSLKKYARSVIW